MIPSNPGQPGNADGSLTVPFRFHELNVHVPSPFSGMIQHG